MNTIPRFLSAILLSGCWLVGSQAQNSITLSFNSLSSIDSVKIENLNNGTRRTIKSNSITLQLNATNSVKELGKIGEPMAYPNPFYREVALELPVFYPSDVSIMIADLSGKLVARFNKYIEQGVHRFAFNPGKPGVYLMKVSNKSSSYNMKLICTGSVAGTPSVEYNGIISAQSKTPNKVRKASVKALADLTVRTGDKLLFTGYSSSRAKLISDVVSTSKNYSFNFSDNIWEYLATNSDLDSVKTYLYSMNKNVFDASRSTPCDVDELGRIIYSDSVSYIDNKIWRKIGCLNNEDSCYFAVFPTNNAWIKSYDNIKPYFRYYGGTSETSRYTADTLQRNNTMQALVSDLTFVKRTQEFPTDSVVSVNKNVFYNPARLLTGASRSEASNGSVFMTDELKFNHWESWNPTITLEAETEKYFTFSTINTKVYVRKYGGNDLELENRISNNGYLKLTPMSPSSSPTATFTIPNTLAGQKDANGKVVAGAAYNIYCVFLPAIVENFLSSSLPTKVKFELFHMSEAGVVPSSTKPVAVYDNNKQFFFIEKDKVTKVLVASNVTFPYSEYGLADIKQNLKLKVTNAVTISEINNKSFTKEMFIDCIIFEPVR